MPSAVVCPVHRVTESTPRTRLSQNVRTSGAPGYRHARPITARNVEALDGVVTTYPPVLPRCAHALLAAERAGCDRRSLLQGPLVPDPPRRSRCGRSPHPMPGAGSATGWLDTRTAR